jgi:hypothetical protein
MEAIRSSETSGTNYGLHGVISQKMILFIFTAVKTSNPIYKNNSHTLINHKIDSIRTKVFVGIFSESRSFGKIPNFNPIVVHKYL